MGLLDAVKDAFRGSRKPAQAPLGLADAQPSAAAPAPPPGPAPAPAPTVEYVVQPGDLLREVAAAHGCTLGQVVALNDINPDLIRPGQVVRLPAPTQGR